MNIDSYFEHISEDIEAFENYFKEAVKSRVPLLDRIMRYIVNRKGKQLRPKFVLLCKTWWKYQRLNPQSCLAG